MIGDALIKTRDTCLGIETCEELFTPASPHVDASLCGAAIFSNSSGSHHNLRKLDQRISLFLEATRKSKGVYIYANQQGCDGDRLYYDGSAMVIVNGEIVAQASQFSLLDVEVVVAAVDLDEVSSARFIPSRGAQVAEVPHYEKVVLDIVLCEGVPSGDMNNAPTSAIVLKYHSPEEEIAV